MSSSVDIIKSKLDIVSVVGTYIKLEKAGVNFKGKCPFHNEKTPSFFVSPDRGSYYCFGCHAKGDIFTFVQEYDGLDFRGALKVLAERAGVELEAFTTEAKSEKDMLYSLVDQACFYFEKELTRNSSASDYLEQRGVRKETISAWRIGFAKAEWRGLYDFLLSKGFTPELMLKAGLIKRKEGTTESFYDTFRGRIMFPIFDPSGRVIAFSGRILVPDPNAPKYVNSPETVLFNKSDVLYGLNKAKQAIREKDSSILVEGQMDLIMMHQAGFTNTVASSGTALTKEHLLRLQKLSNTVVMAFDGDSAGLSAIERSAHIALALDMEVKVAKMPNGLDPADLALREPERLKEVINTSEHIIVHTLSLALKESDDTRIQLKKIVSSVFPFLAYVQSSSERSHFINLISNRTGIKEESLWDDLKRVSLQNQGIIKQVREEVKESVLRSDLIIKKIVGILLWQETHQHPALSVSAIRKKIEEVAGPPDELVALFEGHKEALLFETEAYYNNRDTLSKDVEELLLSLEEEKLKQSLSQKMVLLATAEREKNAEEAMRILKECQDISNRINEIKRIYEKK